jgi:hypothetical protein
MKNEYYKGLPKSFKQVFYAEYRRLPNIYEINFARNEIIVNNLMELFVNNYKKL